MRTDIVFDANGTTLRGWLYLPQKGKAPFRLIVMTHGWGAVKEMYLDHYAEVFVDAGFATLVYDHRNFGASDGLPRQEIDPWAQLRDYRHASPSHAHLPTSIANASAYGARAWRAAMYWSSARWTVA